MISPQELPDNLRAPLGILSGQPSFGANPAMASAMQRAGFNMPAAQPQPGNTATVTVPMPVEPTGMPMPTNFGQTLTPPTNFGQAVAQKVDQHKVGSEPGTWARSLVAGAQQVLSGFGDVSTKPTEQTSPAGGFLEGLAETMANKNVRQKQEKQQAFENQLKTDQAQREKDLTAAQIGHENAAMYHEQVVTHQLGEEAAQKSVEMGRTFWNNLTTGVNPAPMMSPSQGWTSDELKRKLQNYDPAKGSAEIDGTAVHVYPISRVQVGEDKDGPLFQTYYGVAGDIPSKALDKETADLINHSFTPEEIKNRTGDKTPGTSGVHVMEGTVLSGADYGTLTQQAASISTTRAAISKARLDAELGAGATPEQEQANIASKKLGLIPEWMNILARPDVRGNFVKGVEAFQSNPALMKQYPDMAMLAQAAAGGKTAWKDLVDRQAAREVEERRAQAQENASDVLSPKNQERLEQQYRGGLQSVVHARSGGLGLEDQKVDQANHLSALASKYYDAKTGNYEVPKSQYEELVLGLARLISPTGVPQQSVIEGLKTRTGKGDLAGAITYVTGVPVTGSTQQVIKNLLDSIERQAQVAVTNREGYMAMIRAQKPTDLDPTRAAALEKGELVPYVGIVGRGSSQEIPVKAPDGSTHYFKDQKGADAFTALIQQTQGAAKTK